MNAISSIDLVTVTTTKDSIGQTVKTKTYTPVIAKITGVYQKEFFQASQAGIRPQGIATISSHDYSDQDLIRISTQEYSIYRTFLRGVDRIELYYGERVGNDG